MSDGGGHPERSGYVLIVGPLGEDRDWVYATLRWAALEAAAATEEEFFSHDDWVPPELVILDDVAGGEARKETQRRLHRHPSLQGTPIVVLSYDADIDSFTGAITKGAAAYLVKPLRPEGLAAAVRKLVGWRGHADMTERRRRLRRPLLLNVDVDIRPRKRRVSGQLVDASGTGCRVELSEELLPGELVRVILHGHEESTHVALGAEVRWHRVTPAGVHEAGLKFTGTTALLAGKLLGFASTGMT